MTRKHAANIKWNVKYAVSDDGKFGNTENGRLFGSHPDTAWINLYYDGANGMDRSIALIRKIRTVTREANKSILNHEKPSIPRELSSYLSARKMDRVGNFFMIKTHGKMLLMKKSFARLHPPWISERKRLIACTI